MARKAKFIDPILIEQHYSTRVFRGYIDYLIQKLGEAETKEIVEKTGITWEFLNQQANWVSEVFADRFYDQIVSHKKIEKDFSYQAGKLSMDNSRFDPVKAMGVQLLEPHLIFKQIETFSKKYNKTDTVKVNHLSSNQLSLTFHSRRKTPHFDLVIMNWAGSLEKVSELLNLPSEPCKITDRNQQTVTFELKWHSHTKYRFLKRIQLFGAISFFPLFTFAFINLFNKKAVTGLEKQLYPLLLFDLLVTLLSAFLIQKLRLDFLKKTNEVLPDLLKESEENYQELVENKIRLDRRYREANLLAGVIQRMSASHDTRTLIQTTIREIQASLNYDRVLFLKFDKNKNSLEYSTSQGFNSEHLKYLENYKINLTEVTESKFHLGNVFKEQRNILVPVSTDYTKTLSKTGKTLTEVLQPKSFLVCSVFTQHNQYGLLLVDYDKSSKTLDQDDLHFINNIAKQLAICLDSATTLESERNLRTNFQRFVPSRVIQSMMGESEQKLQNGVLRDITVLFSDIRGFTKLTSENEVSLMVQALNYYFEQMNEIIYRHGGIVDKFIGDAVLGVFNGFGDLEDHTTRAVLVACEMQALIPEINEYIKTNITKGKSNIELKIGIGIHTGKAVVGNIGSSQKMEYTVIGETVNLAQRIESETKPYDNSILISSDVAKCLQSSFYLETIGSKEMKGIKERKELYLVRWTETENNLLNPSQLENFGHKEAA